MTLTMLLVSDYSKLPEISHRNADKTAFYIRGSFEQIESGFNMGSHRMRAEFRKLNAGRVGRRGEKRGQRVERTDIEAQYHPTNVR